LAQPPDAPIAGEMLELVILALGNERLGVDVRHVQEIQPLGELTPVPGVAAFWVGLINLRGRLYPVLDLRRYLGLPQRREARLNQPVSQPAKAGGDLRPRQVAARRSPGDREIDADAGAPQDKVVLASAAGMEIALLVDDAPEVRQMPAADVGPPLVTASGRHQVIAGIAAGRRQERAALLTILDLEALFSDPALIAQDQEG
jgi:chemotaxis signal transduction protein